jgi:hypothetical protein
MFGASAVAREMLLTGVLFTKALNELSVDAERTARPEQRETP